MTQSVDGPGSVTAVSPATQIEEFKRRGNFDVLRKELMQAFRESVHMDGFLRQLDESMLAHIDKDADRLVYRDVRLRHSDLMHELDRQAIYQETIQRLSTPAGDGGPVPLLGAGGAITQRITERIADFLPARAAPSSDSEKA